MSDELAMFEELSDDELFRTGGGSCLAYAIQVQVCVPQIIYITGLSPVLYF